MSLSAFLIGLAAGVVLTVGILVVLVVIGGSREKMMDDDIWPHL